MSYPKDRAKRRPINSEEERKDRHREQARNYNKKHADKIREKRTRYIEKNYERYMWSVAKQSAKARGIEFSIDPEDIKIPTHCRYLGVELTKIIGKNKGKVNTNVSLDRIDNSKGYVKGNVQVISALANKLKSNCSIETLVSFAKGVLKTHDT